MATVFSSWSRKIVSMVTVFMVVATLFPVTVFAGGSPTIANIGIDKSPFIPGNGNLVNLSFDLLTDNPAGGIANIKIYQFGNQNHVLKDWGSMVINKDSNKLTWDGLDYSVANHPIATDGLYTFQVTLIGGAPVAMNFDVGTPPTVIAGSVVASPTTINIAQQQETSITFNLNKVATSANVVIIIPNGHITLTAVLQNAATNTYKATWHGRELGDTGNYVAPGSYSYTVSATKAPYGNSGANGPTTLTVVNNNVNNTAPNISGITASQTTLNTNLQQTTTIKYNLDKPATSTSVTIFNGNNSVVLNGVLQGVVNNVYTYTAVWTGRNSAGNAYVPTGSYSYSVSATNNNGTNVAAGPVSIFVTNDIVNDAPNISGISTSQTTINTNLQQTTTIRYNLDKPATSTSVTLFNGNSLVILNGVLQGVVNNVYTYSAVWNGRDNAGNGNYVPTGFYSYNVSATNNSGTNVVAGPISISVTSNIIVDGVPVVSNVSLNPNTFNPNNGGNTTIGYTIDRFVNNVTVDILDNNNNIRKSIVGGTAVNQQNTVIWDGRDSNGFTLPMSSGLGTPYTVRITANSNNSGSGMNSSTVYLSSDSNNSGNCNNSFSTPNINNVSISRSSFSPNNAEIAQISYNIDRAAYVTIDVLDSGNNVVRTLLNNSCQNYQAQNQTITWNGYNNNNSVINGSYTIRVAAHTNSSSTDTEYAYVSVTGGSTGNNGNIISNLNVSPQVFNPRNGQHSTVYFNLNQQANVTVDILDRNGNVVKNLLTNVLRSSSGSSYNTTFGNYSYGDDWYGNNSSGSYPSDNIFQFRVRANATSNGTSDTETGWVEIDTDGSIIGFPNNGGSTGSCAGYTDVYATDHYCKAIQAMKDLGVFTGYSDNTFRPYQMINRAEVAKVMALVFNISTNNSGFLNYRDTDNNAWYKPYILTLQNRGILKGYPDNTFRPTQTINKVELVKVFVKTAPNLTVPYCSYSPYNDTPVNAKTRWYIDYVCLVKNRGWMEDDGSGNFNPEQLMTRGDVANLFYQYEIKGGI